MTKLQYLRWKFFALGMAKHCFPHATEARRNSLIADLESYFSHVEYVWGDHPPLYTKLEGWDACYNVNEGTGLHEAMGCRPRYHCLSDDVDGYFSQYYHEDFKGRERGNKYLNQLQCCLRAGVDVAVNPSGGVIGFTLGDVKKIFYGRLPHWVRAFWDHNPELDTAPDDAPVWL